MPCIRRSQSQSHSRDRRVGSARFKFLLIPLFFGLSCVAGAQCLNGANPQDLAKELLTDKTELAHPAVEVSLSPSEHSVVVLVRPSDDVNTNFRAWVLVPGNIASCRYRSYELPKMVEPPGQFDIEVRSVFGVTVGREKRRDLVVLYRYHKNGSEQDSGFGCYVYAWNGQEFVSEPKLAERVVGLKTAAEVRSKLRE